MAIVSVCGAECRIVTQGAAASANRHWGSVGGTPAISTSVVRSGLASLRFDGAATLPKLAPPLPASQTVAYFRGYFRVSDATPSSDAQLFQFDLAGAGLTMWLKLMTTGVLQFEWAGVSPTTGPTIIADTWYGVEAEGDTTANPNNIKWRIWDSTTGLWTTQTTASRAQAADTINTITFGIPSQGPASGYTIYWDDVLVGTSTTLGEDWSDTVPRAGWVAQHLPNADGTHAFTTNDFEYNDTTGIANTATDIYTYIDEADQTSIADFISQNVAGAGKWIRVGFAPATGAYARSVGVTSTYHSAGTSANEMHLRVTDDGGTSWTNVWGNGSAVGVDVSDISAHFLHKVLATKPSGGAWTPAAISALEAQWGNSDDIVSIPYIDSVSLEVEYQEARPPAAIVTSQAVMRAATW